MGKVTNTLAFTILASLSVPGFAQIPAGSSPWQTMVPLEAAPNSLTAAYTYTNTSNEVETITRLSFVGVPTNFNTSPPNGTFTDLLLTTVNSHGTTGEAHVAVNQYGTISDQSGPGLSGDAQNRVVLNLSPGDTLTVSATRASTTGTTTGYLTTTGYATPTGSSSAWQSYLTLAIADNSASPTLCTAIYTNRSASTELVSNMSWVNTGRGYAFDQVVFFTQTLTHANNAATWVTTGVSLTRLYQGGPPTTSNSMNAVNQGLSLAPGDRLEIIASRATDANGTTAELTIGGTEYAN